MTLLSSENSLLIRSKFRSALKNPAVFHEQRKSLERAKNEDFMKHKMRNRPNKADLLNLHVLQDLSAEGPNQATQTKLKKARLADDLNEKIALRPGPLELVEKNIIPVDSALKEAIKGNHLHCSSASDAFSFDEDSSSDSLSPEPPRSEDSPESSGSMGSPPDSKSAPATSATATGTLQVTSQCVTADGHNVEKSNQPESPKAVSDKETSPIPIPTTIKSKSSSEKNRHKKPKDIKPKVKKLKYHQYIPPDQKADCSPPPMDSAYARLLQQQQLFLQLQILSQQQQSRQNPQHNQQNLQHNQQNPQQNQQNPQHNQQILQHNRQNQQQQHFSYQPNHQPKPKQASDVIRNSGSLPNSANSTCSSPMKSSFPGQNSISSLRLGPLPSNLDELKVSELRQQLRIRGLPVSGTKTALMERLRPFQDLTNNPALISSDVTTVTFPVTPANSLTSYQSQPTSNGLPNSCYQFNSTCSTPPISPASSDFSIGGSLSDSFNDGTISSPHFGLQPSPAHLSPEEGLTSSRNGGSIKSELESFDSDKDKMLVEKQKVINELTWKLQQEQRQVEKLKMQLQQQKRGSSPHEKQETSQHFFGITIKQENVVSSCPFSSGHIAPKCPTNESARNLSSSGAPQIPSIVNNLCMEVHGQGNLLSSSFLSPQCSPQHSPIGSRNSPQHISLPPSPNSQYLLPVSPSSHGGEGYSMSPHSNRLCVAQMTSLQPGNHMNQKFPIPSPNFCNSNSSLSKNKQPPSYEDAVKQQLTRSQQMDELLDVLIETGEMPANAKDNHSGVQKTLQITVSPGQSNVTASKQHGLYEHIPPSRLCFDHSTSNCDSHLESILNTQSPVGRTSALTLLKMTNEPHLEGMVDRFSGKAQEEPTESHEGLENPISPMETQVSPSSTEGAVLNLGFTESPWESMEWLTLTPPSSATSFASITNNGLGMFSTDFLDVPDLNLNAPIDLHLEQW
ncbi:myocardin isoform X2 [Protopterus annectens]|uniref:myocardin isoform X2 n=1 Tax=Protopterus annectens TaxID=7888 RepID=UPI001CFA4A7A|nr:myocardin isoform X2 [Protopterus annectens]